MIKYVYTKRRVVVEEFTVRAFQMTLKRRWDNSEWPEWLNSAWQKAAGENESLWPNPDCPSAPGRESADQLCCVTLGGIAIVNIGDWIIHGEQGEIYTCKRDNFSSIYY